MKVIRAHDYLPPPPTVEFKGLKRIMAGFIAAVVISFCICVATIIRTGKLLRERHTHFAAAHVPCMCMGRCLRAGGSP